MSRPKRVVALGDTHTGHLAGLTPPDFFEGRNSKLWRKVRKLNEECWAAFRKIIHKLQPIDILVVNGDAIEGPGSSSRTGATELIITDLGEQQRAAVQVISTVNAKRVFFTYGTPYHTTALGTDMERKIAEAFGGDIQAQQNLDVNGLVFNCRHKVSNSIVPYGGFTAVARDLLWNHMWADTGEAPEADVLIRSHIHHYAFCGDNRGLAMTLPALQAPMTKYGGRQCVSIVEWGLVHFDVTNKEEYAWQSHLVHLAGVKRRATKV